jgi:putative DNA primase/helicase
VSRLPTEAEDAAWTGEPLSMSVMEPEGRTELANAKRFIEHHGDNVRYVPTWGKWLVWDGTRWQVDDGCTIEQHARAVIDQVWAGTLDRLREVDRTEAAQMVSYAKATASANGVKNFLQLARSEAGIPISHHALDSNEWLLNVQNGTIDLKTGDLRPHNKADYLTKIAPTLYTKNRTSQRWEDFVLEIMAGDVELTAFLQRLCGYWLTGSVRDHVLPIFFGGGANGKSVFLGTIEAMLGTDYAMHAPPDLLMVKKHEAHPTERADLFGKRLVTCMETESGRRLAESLVKELCGGDRVRARFMRQDFFEFSPTHKLVISSNHRPIVKGDDHGVWRRLRLVPFTVTIPPAKQDKALPEKLRKELPGILTWCVRGCLEWQAKGLQEPASVTAATEGYRDESDIMGDFIAECCVVANHEQAAGGRLYEAYSRWCDTNGHEPDNATVFGRKLTERGFHPRKTMNGKVRDGIGLTTKSDF